jgi:hypothetical protein
MREATEILHYDGRWKTEFELTLKQIFLGQLTAASNHRHLVGLERINQPINQSPKETWRSAFVDVFKGESIELNYFDIYIGLFVLIRTPDLTSISNPGSMLQAC